MTKVALVGYRLMPKSQSDGDIITMLPVWISGQEDLEVCSVEFVEERTQTIDQAVAEMLKSSPDVLLYSNYRDYITGKKDDEAYIALTKQKLPIILLSGSANAYDFADKHGIDYLKVPTSLKQIFCRIRQLGDAKYTSINNAVEDIEVLISEKKKPVLIGVFGMSRHGKSRLSEEFEARPDQPLKEKTYISDSDETLPKYEDSGYYLVNVPIFAPDDNTLTLSNSRVEGIAGKQFDLNVLVFNPLMYNRKVDWKKVREQYDLVIINEFSPEKMHYSFKQH